jgi:hypothetical protein
MLTTERERREVETQKDIKDSIVQKINNNRFIINSTFEMIMKELEGMKGIIRIVLNIISKKNRRMST